jgi:hypothetical protein
VASYLILGAGRFGRLALQRLAEREPRSEFWLVDNDPKKLISSLTQENPAIYTAMAPVAAFLAEILESKTPPDWIIPAVPRHVAFDLLWLQRPADGGWRRELVPLAVGKDLPYVQRGVEGELYLSLSTARCPDDCPEPAKRCYLSGAKRNFNLYNYLEKIFLQDYTSLVIRSRQLAPGVGGYRPADLWELRRQVEISNGKILISTACRCHGVCHGLDKLAGMEAVVGI